MSNPKFALLVILIMWCLKSIVKLINTPKSARDADQLIFLNLLNRPVEKCTISHLLR